MSEPFNPALPSGIVLTDPPPIPKNERCRRCGAGPDRRRALETYGGVQHLCGSCAADWPDVEDGAV